MPHRAETNGIAERAFSAESKNGRQHSRRSLDYSSWWREAMACRCSVRQCKDLLADVKTPYERRYGTFLEGPIIPFGASFLCTPFEKDKGRRHSVVPEYSQAYSLGVPRFLGFWTRDLPMWTRKKFK